MAVFGRKIWKMLIIFVTLQHIQDVLRVWAAAQQISSKLGSAFALHHTWIVKEKVRRSSRETG